MANFKTHQNGAVMAGVVASVASYSLGMTDLTQSFFVLAVGYFGGLAPDLDHDSSIPLKSVFKIISLGTPIILIHKHRIAHFSDANHRIICCTEYIYLLSHSLDFYQTDDSSWDIPFCPRHYHLR